MQELRSELLSSSSPSPSSASQGWGGWQLVPFGNLCPLQEGSLRRRGEGRELSRHQSISKIVPCYACTNSPPGEACAQAEGFAGQTPSPAFSSSGEDARGAQSSSNLSPSPQGLWPAGGWCSRAPASQTLGWEQGRARYSLGVSGSTGEEHRDCAAARYPRVRQAQLTRAQATQIRDRETRAQPTVSFLKIQLRT